VSRVTVLFTLTRHARRVDDGGSTIRELFDWWLLEKRKRRPALSSNTLNGYEREANAWCEHIGTTKGDSLKYGQVNEALEIMGRRRDPQSKPEGFHGRWVEKLSIESLHRRQSILRNMLNFALIHGPISKNVAAGRMSALGESLDSTTEDEDVWTEELSDTSFETRWGPTQTAEFLDRLVRPQMGNPVHALRLYSGPESGMARSSPCGHQEQRIDRCGHHPDRVQEERGQRTGIELLNRHLTAMDEHRKKTGSQYVDHFLIFAEEDGSPIHPGAITKEFARLIREAGLPSIRLHDLRHNAASLFLAAGVPVEVVAKMTGHDGSSCGSSITTSAPS
jgi:site-specific recombinase XerD